MTRPFLSRCISVSASAFLLAAFTILSGCSGNLKTAYLSGRAVSPDKLAGATVSVYDKSGDLLMKKQNATGSEGLYNIAHTKIPSAFTIVVTGGKRPDGKAFTGYLKRAVKRYDPAAYYEVNWLTTLVAVYMERHPGDGYDRAVTAVRKYLGLPDDDTFAEISAASSLSDAWVSNAAFWDRVTDGTKYAAFLDNVMKEIEAGRTADLKDASLTADLRTLLGTGKAKAKTTATATAKKAQSTDPASAVLGVVGEVFDGVMEIMDMQEDETNVETLNRIDENINKMASQLSDIRAQTTRIERILTSDQWTKVSDELRKIELGCIAPAREALSEVVAYKKEMASMTAADRVEAKKVLQDKITRFNDLMVKPECSGVSFKSYESLLDAYANTVTRIDEEKDRAAIQLFANVVSMKSNDTAECADCTYQSIENTFLRFVYYQATGMQLYLHHELNKLPKAKWAKKKQEIVDRFIRGTEEFDKERMLKQVGRFVPAVETFVVGHDSEAYYKRWLACDITTSLRTDPAAGACKNYERPFLRSQVITDQLNGHIKNRDGVVAGSKYGFFLKAIQMKTSGVEGLKGKGLVVKMPDGSRRTIAPAEVKDITGKNPYRSYGEKENATWHIASYRIEGIGTPGALGFELAYDGNDSATPVYFRNDVSIDAVKDTASGKYYSAFGLWTVPVRDLKALYMAFNRGWGFWSYLPYTVAKCGDEACTSITANLKNEKAEGTPLRLYRIGAEIDHVAIGYRLNGKRYILLPSNVWDWPDGGGAFNKYERIDAYATKDIPGSDKASKIYWYMEHDPGVAWGNAYYFSRINEKNEKKYLSYFENASNLFYDAKLLRTFKPSFNGEWK